MSGTGAQVILDPASDAARGARGVAATTHAQNTVIRDANLISNALDPVYTKGPPSLVAPMALNFMVPGSLDPLLTFTRASTGTYFDSTGTMQTAAVECATLGLRSGVVTIARVVAGGRANEPVAAKRRREQRRMDQTRDHSSGPDSHG